MQQENNKKEESSFLFFLRLVISNWKLLLGTYALVGIITVIILLVIPKWYQSEATIVIMEENNSSISNVMSEFSNLGLGLGTSGNVETYMQYLNTHKMYDRLIERFNLGEEYETKFREDTYNAIFENMNVVDNENRTFTVSYSYKEDPQKAKEIVQFLYEQLDQIALEVDKAEAANFRKYIENYYNELQSQLKTDEDSMARFQSRTGLLDLETQLEATITGLAELEKERITLEIEANYLRDGVQGSSRLGEIESRIQAINDKIRELRQNQNNTFVALDHIPQQGADFLRLQRDIMVGEKVAEFLRLQYEQALLDEQKINSNLYMVDPPQVPQKKSKPQRTKILFVVMFFTVVFSLVYIRGKEFYKTNKEQLDSLVK